MTSIILKNASVDFPVFSGAGRSLKNEVIKIATGGAIKMGDDGYVTVRGLDAVNLTAKEGDRIGIIGHNGAGKTTLLRVLSGIYRPTSGFAEIDGDSVSLINISLGIDAEATGRENIRLRTAFMGIGKAQLDNCYDEIADFTELGDFLDMPFRTYSAGMQLRLAFAISTSIKPEILIMDEWLSAGDAAFQEKANIRLKEIIKTTKILILASHSRELLLANCNRVLWMVHGKIVLDGAAESVLDAYYAALGQGTQRTL